MNQLVKNLLQEKINDILHSFEIEMSNDEIEGVFEYLYQDLKSFANRDPGSQHNMLYILDSYTSYFAVIFYRIAHLLYVRGDTVIARQLSEYAKLKSGIEIHPGAKIGKYFVLDHGLGTVIGETTIIGERCYILQNVVLGAAGIANNKNGQRHPIIGNDVEIGSFVRIYGTVTVGDNVKISPGAIIKNDIPDNAKIIVSSKYQIMKAEDSVYYTGYYINGGRVITYYRGNNLLDYRSIELFIKGKKIEKLKVDPNMIEFESNDSSLMLGHIEIDVSDEKILKIFFA